MPSASTKTKASPETNTILSNFSPIIWISIQLINSMVDLTEINAAGENNKSFSTAIIPRKTLLVNKLNDSREGKSWVFTKCQSTK